MKIIKCDICGKEIEDGVSYPPEINHYMLPLWQEADDDERHIATDEADICEDCAKKIADFIDGKCDRTNVGYIEEANRELARLKRKMKRLSERHRQND